MSLMLPVMTAEQADRLLSRAFDTVIPELQNLAASSSDGNARKKWQLAVAVADHTGALLVLRRSELAMPAAANIATGKARTAVFFATDTINLERAVNGSENELKGGQGRAVLLSAGPHVLLGGGVPLRWKAPTDASSTPVVVGAVGVSGATPSEDHKVAVALQSLFEVRNELRSNL